MSSSPGEKSFKKKEGENAERGNKEKQRRADRMQRNRKT